MAKDNANPSPQLYLKIMKRLRQEERILAGKRIILFSIMFSSSLAGLVSVGKMLVSQLQTSGFISFASLIFSDFDVAAAYWQNLLLAILEAMPTMSIALCLAILLIALQSIRLLSKNIKTILWI
ncbi:MAG TPA: hypothetical protein PLF16_02085 [Candidatus Staskawiczbacteria bacterium]|nr:hypothetical protein [Candidatus Staskawiczbacteria bacterium]